MFLYSVFLRLSCYLDLILVLILDKDHLHSFFGIFFWAELKNLLWAIFLDKVNNSVILSDGITMTFSGTWNNTCEDYNVFPFHCILKP